MVAFVIWE
jgi:hypothetical protein